MSERLIQGTEAWLACRTGYATASRFKDILARIKSGEAAARRDYRFQLAVERLTGQPVETYSNAAMQHGTDTEPLAREAFELHTGLMVEEVGFLVHPELMAGCSPDGLVDDNAGLEIKSPWNSTIHIITLLNGMPSEHRTQIQGAMWITGRKRWHFVSYDPRLQHRLRLYHEIIERDEDYIATLEGEVRLFLTEVDALLETLREKLK